MDNLVLIRVAAALDASLAGAVLQDVRGEGGQRFRIVFDGQERPRSIVVSLRPDSPWLGRPMGRFPWPGPAVQPFAATCCRLLRGAVLARIVKPPAERRVELRFAEGKSLVADLAGSAANLTLVGEDGRVLAAARAPRRPIAARAAGPSERLDPFACAPSAIDMWIERHVSEGSRRDVALARTLRGVSREGARLVDAEAALTGSSVGQVLAARLRGLAQGSLDPVIEAERDPLEAAALGALAPGSVRLLPWDPLPPILPACRRSAGEPAATAGLYHDAVDRQASLDRWSTGLRRLLAAEVRRLRQAEAGAAADELGFADADSWRIRGEALLAGLTRVERRGEALLVPDPYRADEATLVIPVRRGASPQQAAEDCFRRHRRARRGSELARRRLETLRAGRLALEQLEQRYADAVDPEGLRELERAMQRVGLPVGLAEQARPQRARVTDRPRSEGVRMFRSADGAQILVGKGGRENQRLTFHLAGPEDFWLHAQGVPGAHVVVRNEARLARPPQATLIMAAGLAAWFSDARPHAGVDVQWTRRKYVRPVKGAPAGTVRLKKADVIRVRPCLPEAVDPLAELP